jgi:hypothetical protein
MIVVVDLIPMNLIEIEMMMVKIAVVGLVVHPFDYFDEM